MTDVSLEVTREEINSGVKKANNLNGTADEINTILGKVSEKQDKLVSGTNIKTINNKSILGSGNITIEGGSGGGSSDYYPPLLSTMWSDHLLNDESWLRADTFSWQDGTTYSTAYEKLVEEYATGSEETYNKRIAWSQPALSSDTSYGTVSSTSLYDGYDAYLPFRSGDTGKYLSASTSSGDITWQLPEAIAVSKCSVKQIDESSYLTRFPQSITIYGSNDGNTWDKLGSNSGYSCPEVNSYVDITCDSTNLYSYIKWEFGEVFSGGSPGVEVGNIKITATKQVSDSIIYKRTTNGFKIATVDYESAVLAKYNNDDIAWYYILDEENKRFKLPRTKFGFEGLRDNVGDDIEESLPNITGVVGELVNPSSSGAFQSVASFSRSYSSGSYQDGDVTFDASRCSSAYQDGAPVQERATQMYLYFYVGEYSQSATEQTAGLNSELFNEKIDLNFNNASYTPANVDANNFSSTGLDFLSSACMPSSKYDNLTLGASGSSYVAPANGWVLLYASTTSSNNYAYGLTNGTAKVSNLIRLATSGIWFSMYIPVSKNDTYSILYEGSLGSTSKFQFIYAKGES